MKNASANLHFLTIIILKIADSMRSMREGRNSLPNESLLGGLGNLLCPEFPGFQYCHTHACFTSHGTHLFFLYKIVTGTSKWVFIIFSCSGM